MFSVKSKPEYIVKLFLRGLWAKTSAITCFCLLIAGWTTHSFSAVVFEENFDAQENWQPNDNNESCNNVSATCSGDPPQNWTYFRSTEKWHPGEAAYSSKQPAQQISNRQFRGASGKSWVRYHESSGTNQSTFGDDALLVNTPPAKSRWLHNYG